MENEQSNPVCRVCHQVIQTEWYFCPNCGAKLHEAPLSTSAGRQAWIYFFSIILPMMGFIFVTRWPGTKYAKSLDPKARQVGQIAWFFLILSTICTIWYAVVWTQNYIQQTVNSINADFNY